VQLPFPWTDYPDAASFDDAWCALARSAGARATQAGTSVEGRPLRRFEFGNPRGPTALLTALVHGIEFIGALALFEFVQRLAGGSELLRHANLVVLPIVNPDALAANTARLAHGRRAFRRGNARGVDLNRNFPRASARVPLHPFAGSRFRASPHYMGPHPVSEPETEAVCATARATRPAVSLGFHSFGELLLYPWAHTRRPNPRRARYERVGARLRDGVPGARYQVKQATQWYATVGDLDDWLDEELGTLAFTVEVSRPMASRANRFRALDPFAWMNPVRVEPVTTELAPGLDALLTEALA
jgi:predicted deacylase